MLFEVLNHVTLNIAFKLMMIWNFENTINTGKQSLERELTWITEPN